MEQVEIKKRISLFIILWCVANLIHTISFVTFSNGISSLEVIRISILFLCVAQLIYKKGYYFFLPALLLSSMIVIRLPGSVPNHIFFEGIINITLLLFASYYIIKYYFFNLSIDQIEVKIYNTIAPFIRFSLVVLYFFVVLHKLNYDFFDPYISCSGDFFSRILEDFGLTNIEIIDKFHTNNYIALRNFSIYFAIISEAIIPILLLNKKLRNIGVLYGILFHIILALHFHGGIYSFSAMIFNYYLFFFNNKTVDTFLHYFNRRRFTYIVIAVLCLIGILYGLIPTDPNTLFLRSTTKLLFIGLIFFLLYAILYLFIFLKNFTSIKSLYDSEKTKTLSFRLKLSTGLVILFIFFTGFSPYLGLRTEVCFSMFSNLQTESNLNNHFFISPKLRVFSYQDELVTIKSSNIEYLKFYIEDPNTKLVPFELDRIVNVNSQDFYIDYEYRGEERKIERINGVVSGDRINIYSNLVLSKFLTFRPVLVKNKCQH